MPKRQRGGKTKIVKPVFQDNDASQANYLKNRRALVGPGCTVNSLFDGVNVVAGVSNLQNLCNEDLSDYTTLPGLASVVAGASPIISIKDNKNYYAADMEAGFSICAASDAKILSLDLAKFYKIQFLCDGEKVGDLQRISEGQSVTGLGLSLLTIPGDTLVTKSFVAKAPGKFNEIKLVQCGVDATVLSLIKVKYAFVGKAREYTITNNTTNGIGVYAKEQGRGAFTLSTDPHDGFGHLLNKPSCLIDVDLTNSFTVSAVVSLGASTPITVYAKPSDGKEAFPAGTEVGFKYNSPSVLKLYNIKLFNKGKEVYHSATTHWGAISAGLVGKEETNKKCLSIDVPADLEFDEAVLYNTGLLKADLAQLNIYYAYVSDATKDNAIENALYGAESISTDNTNASVDLEHTKLFSVANVGNGYDRIGNLIDGDPETSFVLPLGVNIGGATVAVNIGKTVNPGKQLVMTTDNLALGLGVNLGDVLKVTTYLNGEEMESLSNWQALSASVISTSGKANVSARAAAAGSDNKGYLVLTPTKPFDNVRIKQVDVASVLSNITIYDLALRNNISEEGSVNTGKDLVLDENYKLTETNTVDGARLVFNRTFATGKWNSLILPVDMSLAQVKDAFGEDAELSEFDKMDGTWIYFKPVTTETNGVLLQKNKPYIIKPTKEPLANCEYTVDGSTQTLEGKIYIVNGVNYTDQTSEMVRSDNGNGVGMVIKGGYSSPTAVPSRSYMLNNGNMIHTAKVHNVKAYRTWLEETTPSNKNLQMAIRYADDDNTATGITVVEEQDHTSANGIYTISGMRVDGYNAGNLPKGMYIVNNRKMIVK